VLLEKFKGVFENSRGLYLNKIKLRGLCVKRQGLGIFLN
jgi:hypothetical protein